MPQTTMEQSAIYGLYGELQAVQLNARFNETWVLLILESRIKDHT
jgi:hypothetical protein